MQKEQRSEMREGESVRSIERSARMPGVSKRRNNRLGLRTSDSSQSTKYGYTNITGDGSIARRCWGPSVNAHPPPPPVVCHRYNSGDVKPNILVGEKAKTAK